MDRRYDVIGNRITIATRQSAREDLLARLRDRTGGYVCFVNAHVAVTARENQDVMTAVNGSFMSLPDGRPVYVAGRLMGIRPLEPIPGPDFLESVLAVEAQPPLRHYFLGARREVLDRLAEVIVRRFPTTAIAGTYSPPFRSMSEAEWQDIFSTIRATRPDVVWVGLGAPRQELFMSAHWRSLAPAVLLGVGAAFDFMAGSVARAPLWMRRLGLEWCFRLISEPRRLWRRYAYTNTMFIAYLFRDLIGRKSGQSR
ncbi:MAG: WecB/TagA/CpsF family glycosyltransferase [Gammaproteobacteria bacterium]|nr:MAG: WecB/TagA/CpsF family glycosyltransferase [Gammaproteobacteria bacterium]